MITINGSTFLLKPTLIHFTYRF